MKLKTALIVLAIAAMTVAAAPASWANTLTYQDVTFNLNGSGGVLTLEINGVDGASGNWTGIQYLSAFSLKDIGVTTLSLAGWTLSTNELNANGCTGGSPPSNFCFTKDGGPFLLSNNNTFTLNYTGTLNLDAPHLMVNFMISDTQDKATGSVLSAIIPGTSVPEPASLMLLGAALTGFGIFRRKLA